MKKEKNLYEILGVDKNVSEEDLKKAFRNLSKQYHPDALYGKSEEEKKQAEEKFKELSEAYSILSDKEKREQYDRFGTKGGNTPYDMGEFFRQHSDLFDHFGFGFNPFGNSGFDFFGRGRSHNSPRDDSSPKNGRDIQITIQIPLMESINGGTREFDIPIRKECPECHGSGGKNGTKLENCTQCNGTGSVTTVRRMGNGVSYTTLPCPKCHGTGKSLDNACPSCHGEKQVKTPQHIRLKIPRGIESGTKLMMKGFGEEGLNGGLPGNLYVVVEILEDKIFKRSGKNLRTICFVNPLIAMIGGEAEVPTLHGIKKINIPENTQQGTVLKLENEGIDDSGSLFVEIIYDMVEIPVKIKEKLSTIVNKGNFVGRSFQKQKEYYASQNYSLDNNKS